MNRFLFFFLAVVIIGNASNVNATDYMTRFGITLMESGLISLSVERHFVQNSVKVNVGWLPYSSFSEISFKDFNVFTFFTRYNTNNKNNTFEGIGLGGPLYFFKDISMRNVGVTFLLGIDCKTSDRNYIGFDVNTFINTKDGVTPIPGLYHKYRL